MQFSSHLISLTTEIYLNNIPPVSPTCSEARAPFTENTVYRHETEYKVRRY